MSALTRFMDLFRPKADTTLRSPATWFLDWLGGSEASSGVRVSSWTALGLSAYYCGINMISSTVASLPLNVYKRIDDKRREVAPKHPVHRLLHSEPNPEMGAMVFRQIMVAHAIARGNSYAEIERGIDGTPRNLWPLLPHLTRPIRDEDKRLWYETRTDESSEFRFLKAENVLHVPAYTYNGIQGEGLIKLAKDEIGLNVAQEQYAAKFFRNGGNISGTIDSPTPLRDDAFKRLKAEIAEKFSGLTNAHRIAILENGMKFNPINPTHEEAQLIESRRFSIEQWARWLQMPPHKLREMSKATFSNIEHQNIEWVVDTIRPWVIRYEQEYDRKLFANKNMFYAKHVLDGLLRGDQKSRFDSYAVGRMWGWMSANDVRELEDVNPLSADIGDIYLMPANMTRADQTTGPEQAAAERVVRQEDRALASKGIKGTYGPEFDSRVAQWMGISEDKAKRYSSISLQLQLVALENGIGESELHAAKVSMLVQIARNGIRSIDTEQENDYAITNSA